MVALRSGFDLNALSGSASYGRARTPNHRQAEAINPPLSQRGL